ncbi:hypothetical protein [Chelatococcus reniformis]|uniref:Mu-like prophage DNA circulation protein n=1 Tax=Chelatococcus reniformis TaxID=1494448 RepID=A0A916XGU9_9HYPH|nr:hypothetical protein [Chelatococcus reniformis]GGC70851.1 hypothetical protein GCM10010994_31790 [Chelatococcus reniformis]
MKASDAKEAAALLSPVLDALLTSATDRASAEAADLRRQVGALQASAETVISNATLPAPLLACFDAARGAGATLDTMAAVRAIAVGAVASVNAAETVRQLCIRFCLIAEARVLAGVTLTSREDVDRLRDRFNAAFDPAEEFAADAMDSVNYKALVALHAAVIHDLVTRARPLPRIVNYRLAETFPTLVIANRLYGDAGRADELRAENKIIHPAFPPRAGRALSA